MRFEVEIQSINQKLCEYWPGQFGKPRVAEFLHLQSIERLSRAPHLDQQRRHNPGSNEADLGKELAPTRPFSSLFPGVV